MSNNVKLIGKIVTGYSHHHSLYGEGFYTATISVKRSSGTVDLIPLMISDRIVNINEDMTDACVYVCGEFRSYNQHDTDKNRLKLHVFVNTIEILDTDNDENDVILEGYICKQPTFRQTPLGRQISDVILAVNRAYNKSDYIPCIFWGRNASYVSSLTTGSQLKISGRIQSREYIKDEDTKTAYEISVSKLELC